MIPNNLNVSYSKVNQSVDDPNLMTQTRKKSELRKFWERSETESVPKIYCEKKCIFNLITIRYKESVFTHI